MGSYWGQHLGGEGGDPGPCLEILLGDQVLATGHTVGIQACPRCPPEPAFKELQDGLSGRKEGEPLPPILGEAALPGEQASLPSPPVPRLP